jgi:hypothetical protein
MNTKTKANNGGMFYHWIINKWTIIIQKPIEISIEFE